MIKTKENGKEKDKEILDEIKENIARWYDYFKDNITNYKDEVDFVVNGNQWDESSVKEYERRRKPMLTINKLYSYIQQIVGEQRSKDSNIKVRSINGVVSQQELSLSKGLLKSIAYNSKADIVYQTGLECSLLGFGAMGVKTDYENENSFNQKVEFYSIPEPYKAFFDPSAEDVTKSDGDYCGVYTIMTRKEFESAYPNIEVPTTLPASDNNVAGVFDWISKEEVVIADIYKKKWKKKKIVLLSDGRTVDKKDAEQIIEDHYNSLTYDENNIIAPSFIPLEIIDERETNYYEIYHYKIGAAEVLEKSLWPSKYLPIVFEDGNSFYLNGKQITKSFTLFARDAQKFYNFLKSDITQYVKSGRKEQFMGPNGCIKDNKNIWKNPDTVQGYLGYDIVNGMKPERVPPIEIPSTLINQQAYVDTELHTVLGLFNANRGAAGNEISGVAIANKIRQGNNSAYIYIDNRDRAIEQLDRVALSLFPSIYDTQRVVHITDDDGNSKQIEINDGRNNLSRAELDIEVEAGSSFALQKFENLTALKDLISVYPQAASLVADKYAKNLDLDDSIVIRDRLKELVPPEIIAKEEGRPPPPPKQNPMAMLQMQAAKAQVDRTQSETHKNNTTALKNTIDAQTAQLDAINEFMKTRHSREDREAQLELGHKKADAEIAKAYLDLLAKVQETGKQLEQLPGERL